MTVFENIAFGLRVRPRAQRPADEARSASRVQRAARAGAARRARAALSRAALRRPAPARGAGPRARRSSRACCCSTSRSARSTPRCARSCAAGCASCTTTPASPRCSSPTTRKRRSSSPTGSCVMNQRPHRAGRHAGRGLRAARPRRSSTASSARRCACRSMPPALGSAWALIDRDRRRKHRGPGRAVRAAARLAHGRSARRTRSRPGWSRVRRSGTSRRAELALAEGLPTVEIELPPDHAVPRGDVCRSGSPPCN